MKTLSEQVAELLELVDAQAEIIADLRARLREHEGPIPALEKIIEEYVDKK